MNWDEWKAELKERYDLLKGVHAFAHAVQSEKG
jgi:hypothetical protein